MTDSIPIQSVGGYLRDWRRRRRMSQFDLASDADISTKHLSFLETGRAKPSRQMLLLLAARLDIPLRDRNVLLNAAGLPSIYQERTFVGPALEMVRRDVETVLSAHDPNPAMAVDRHWFMLAANRAVAHLVAGAEPLLLRPPVNLPRLMLHPAGLASRIVNLTQWRTQLVARLRRQIDLTGDPVVMELLEEVCDYPCPVTSRSSARVTEIDTIATPFRLATIDGVLSFFCATTQFVMPVDITVAELTVEAFLPADPETAAIMQRLAHQDDPIQDMRSAAVHHIEAA